MLVIPRQDMVYRNAIRQAGVPFEYEGNVPPACCVAVPEVDQAKKAGEAVVAAEAGPDKAGPAPDKDGPAPDKDGPAARQQKQAKNSDR